MTATFGREFSKLELGFSWLHPTEVVIAVAATVAVIRLGPSAALSRIRATGALIPLVALWLVGTVAAIRGLQDWGFSLVLHDIGLVEYSVIVPLLALVVANRQQLLWLVKVLALGGLLAVLVQVLNHWTPEEWELGADLGLIEVASGMYIGMYVAWVISRVAAGLDVARWHYLVAVLGVAFVVIGASRAAWLGLLAALVIALILAPRDTRLLTAIVAAAVVVLGAGFSIPAERLDPGARRGRHADCDQRGRRKPRLRRREWSRVEHGLASCILEVSDRAVGRAAGDRRGLRRPQQLHLERHSL